MCMQVCGEWEGEDSGEAKRLSFSLIPRPIPASQCFTLKSMRAWYAKSHASCYDDQSWCGMMQTKSRSIKVNKTRLFLRCPYLLSIMNIQFEPLKDYLLLIWKWYLRVSCQLWALVTFDPLGVLELLSPSFSIMWLCIPGPPKSWEWAWGLG